jgi:hypothetical protein
MAVFYVYMCASRTPLARVSAPKGKVAALRYKCNRMCNREPHGDRLEIHSGAWD